MNRKLLAALWIVAVVSIAIALYYPVTQYLEGKAIDDEMLKLRQMKADAVSGAPDAEPLPAQTDQSAASGGTSGDQADPGLDVAEISASETGEDAGPKDSNVGLVGMPEKPNVASTDRMPETDRTARETTDRIPIPDETANGLTDQMAKPDENATDRKADSNEAAANTSNGTVVADENSGGTADQKAEADEAAGAATGSVTAIEDEAASNTDRSTKTLDDITNSMLDHSKVTGTEREAAGINGSVVRDAGGTAEKQTGVGEAVSPEPESADKAAIADKSAFGGVPSPAVEPAPAPTPVPEPEPTPFVFEESRILPEYKALYEENRDLVGWLKIDGTMVDYPVLQRADEEYYLTRDFYGNNNANGQLILDAQCDPFTPDVNLVISGHDMKSGKMFGTLQRYASERFGKQHPIIEFDTLFWRGRYRLVAAFQTWDYLRREDGFRYNVDIRYRLELKNYLEELDQIKLYDTGVPVEFGDQLITLSTCSTQTDDGRFVVVARRLREGEQPQD